MVPIPSHYPGYVIAAARALLSLTQAQVAAGANISVSTLKRIEAKGELVEPAGPPSNNYRAVVRFLESAGVIFIPRDAAGGEGARLAHWDSSHNEVLESIGVRLHSEPD